MQPSPDRVDREALIVGMTLVPALLSRNKSFALFEDPEVRRARFRASLLRGIVRQLAGGRVESLEVVAAKRGGDRDLRELRYRVPGIRVDRRALLTEAEYACVAYLAGRASVEGLSASDEDRARIDAALRRLSASLKLAEMEPTAG
ncbi:MAG: hypothetical protein FWD17_05015 [Polyangiaceae bacterium]|nr:hypothetical protein [Polyangiaceae bacterium]